MLFHYDGVIDDWGDLEWSSTAIHVSAINQTKWYDDLTKLCLIKGLLYFVCISELW